MSADNVTVTIDSAELQDLFFKVMQWFTPTEQSACHQEAMQLVKTYIRQNFDKEGQLAKLDDPGCTPYAAWPSLSDMTQKQRERLGYNADHPILKRTGSLKSSFDGVQTSPLSWEVGSNDIRAALLHSGGTVRVYGKHQAQIPQRPMVWEFSEQRLDTVLEVYRRRLRKVLDV